MRAGRQVVCFDVVGPATVRVVADCLECGKRFSSPPFDRSKLKELETRHVRDVFPDWSPADRELYFVSGLCGACRDRIMATSEDGDGEA